MWIPLCVPFEEKQEVKDLGAKWNSIDRVWCAPKGSAVDFIKWAPRYYLKAEQPGLFDEGPTITCEVVPSTCMFSNLRSILEPEEWDDIRKRIYKSKGYRCEICGSIGDAHPVEAHETWHYNDKTHVQSLMGIACLCPSCHQVKHIGLAQQQGKLKEAVAHLMEVNEWNMGTVMAYLQRQAEIYEDRSQYEWDLDLSWLENMGYSIDVEDRFTDKAKEAKSKALEEWE